VLAEGRRAPRRTADRPARSSRSGRPPSSSAVGRAAGALLGLVVVLAVVLSTAPREPEPVPVDVLLASFQDPAPPASVTLTVLDGRLTATWPNSSEDRVRGYSVSVTSGGTTRALGEHSSPYTVTGLTNGTAYTVSIRTVTYDAGFIGIGSQGPNTGSRATTSTATPLALPPTGLTTTSADRQLTLTWNAPADPTVNGYRIFSGGVQIANTNASTRTYQRTGLTNGQTYTATVRATYSSGAVSADSASASGVPRDGVAPSAPTGLGADRGDGSVTLTWAANGEADLAGYRVLRNGSAITTTGTSPRSFTDTGLTNDTTYQYSLQAVDTSGNASPASSQVAATPTDLTPPAPPTGLRAVAGDGQVVLTWNPLPEPDAACVIVTTDYVDDYTCIPATTTTATVTGLTNDRQYRFTVVAHDTHGNYGGDSDPVYATPVDMTAPAVPTGLTAVRGDGQVSLTWTANTETDLDGYDLFRRAAGASSSVRVSGAVLGTAATSWTDSGLTNDVEYTYTLRARDRAGNSSASSPGVAATPTDLTAPAVPVRPSAVAGDGVVSLSWTANSERDLASYRVLRDGAVIATVTQPTTTYADRSVTNGRSYDYALVAVDTHGNASAATTPVVTASPRDLTPPAVPTGLTATRGDGRVVLSWTANTEGDLASYRVLRGTTVVAEVAAPATTYADTGLTNDTTYEYHLAAYDTAGNGSATTSSPVTATPTDLTPPAAPTGVGSTPGDGEVVVRWTANTEPDLAAYRVYRGGQLVATIPVAAPPSTTPTSYRDSGLANGTVRTYAVTAVDGHGNESPTSTTSATPADTTAPGAPGGLATTPGDRQVQLSWTASPASDVATYRVLRDGIEIATVPATATSYTDTTPTNGRAYAYAVVAVDTAANRSPASTTATATPRDGTAPAAPTGVSATPGNASATVRWTPPADSDLATYRVLRADGSTAATVAAPATSAVVSGLTNGTPSTFTVVVVDTSGNASPASAAVTTTPAAPVATFSAQGAGTSGALAVSPDGRWVVLSTTARLEGAPTADTDDLEELYRVDTTGQTPARRIAPLRTRAPYVTDSTQTSEVAVSSSGRYVVLATVDALVASDENGRLDVYRADMSTAPPSYALVSVPGAASGRSAGQVSASAAGTLVQETSTVQGKVPGLAVSDDGTRVLFYSARTDLLASGSTSGTGVFAKDLTGSDPSRGPVALVSADTGGSTLSRTPTGPALAITPDGRYAVFTATSSSSGYAVLRKDLGATTAGAASSTGELLLASSTPPVAGQQSEVGAGRDTGQVSVSADGRFVAFLSAAQLTSARPRSTGSASTAYLKDLVTGAVTAIGSPSSGVEEEQVSLSRDGATAAFTTAAALVAADRNAKPDAYRRDLASGGLSLVTADAAGAPTPAVVGAAYRGRPVDLGGPLVVVLTVQALDPADTNSVRDAYLKDLATGRVTSLVRP